MIPKIIHYCWFGGNPLPELAQRCIVSWREFLPDYEIREWNETNYDVRKIPYTAQAYDAKKYAFVSDYARFDILCQHGGIYFDTDVEVIRPLDDILERGAFAGVERAGALNAGLGIASPAASQIYREILDSYQDEQFVNADGSLNLKTVVVRVSDIFRRHGFVEEDRIQFVADTTVYPSEYFCPKDYRTGALNVTENTYTIHHFDGSWLAREDLEKVKLGRKIHSKIRIKFLAEIIFLTQCFLKRLKREGIGKTLKYYFNKHFFQKHDRSRK